MAPVKTTTVVKSASRPLAIVSVRVVLVGYTLQSTTIKKNVDIVFLKHTRLDKRLKTRKSCASGQIGGRIAEDCLFERQIEIKLW